jgi:putative ABC transport system permease protein
MAFTGLLPLLRGLRSQPGFSILAVLTLALGIGVNVAIFSALDALVLNPLPFKQSDRLVAVYEEASFVGYPQNTPAPADYFDWKRQAKSFEDIGATRFCRAVLTGDAAPEQVLCRSLTANMWPILGVNPIRGRWFSADEDHPDPNVVVIGEGLWTRRYARDESLVGRDIRINDVSFKVVGIMPEWFRFTNRSELWTPAAFTPQQIAQRGSHYLNCYGRLKPGVTVRQAEIELQEIQKRINKTYPNDIDPRTGASLEPLRDAMVGKIGPALWILMGAAAIVLLIACGNVANLLLARATGRQRELAVRSALGASTGDLLGQVFAETLFLTCAGGLVGVVLALASKGLLENFVPAGLKGTIGIDLDVRVLLFAFVASLAAATIASLAPILHLLRTPLVNVLRQDSRSGGSGRGVVRLRGLLVVGEVALTVTLLCGAGLMIRSLLEVWKTDIGFRTDKLMTVSVSLPGKKYADEQKRLQFYDRVLERLRAMPEIAAADFASTPPFFSIGNSNGFAVEGRTAPNRWEDSDMLTRIDTPTYLETIGATLVAGRHFTAADREGAPDVAIVNESFARVFFPNDTAIGKRMSLNDESTDEDRMKRRWRTIVGVVKEVRERGYDPAPKPVTYSLVRQTSSVFGGPLGQLVVRSRLVDPLLLLNSVRQAIQEVDPDQPIGQARTFDEVLALDQASRRQQMVLLALFAALSLVMACLGIYAILAYSVELRRQEIGVRMALGARWGDVMRLIAVDGMKLAGLGGLLGLVAVAFGGRVLESSLYGVKAFDPMTLGTVCGVLGLVALLACLIPARRAASTSPSVALRS